MIFLLLFGIAGAGLFLHLYSQGYVRNNGVDSLCPEDFEFRKVVNEAD